ncbi:hypothetical protein [Methanoregula sp.]
MGKLYPELKLRRNPLFECPSPDLNRGQPDLQRPIWASFEFKEQDLKDFTALNTIGRCKGTIRVIDQVFDYLMDYTQGILNKKILIAMNTDIMQNKYSYSSKKKFYQYICKFIRYLAESRDNPMISALVMYMRMPKVRREIKLMTPRIMVTEDVQEAIAKIHSNPLVQDDRKRHYTGLLLFLAYSGQRPTTVSRLTVGQFRKALAANPNVLIVESWQDKIRMAHYVPLHPVLIPYLTDMIKDRANSERMFSTFGLQTYLVRHPMPLHKIQGTLDLKDMRKLFEQKSDELGFTDANKNYIMSHGVSSINWTSYKAFLPENIYRVYMKYWGNVKICPSLSL